MDETITSSQTFLEPARVLVNTEPLIISTVLGSSIAVCMWNRKKKFGGMCHYIYPEIKDKNKTTVKYGNVAIYVLIKTMGEFGSSLSDMEAHIFGGSKSLDHTHQQGMVEVENIRVARTTLERYNIKVVSEDVGGHMGRKIVFNTATNEVLVYKVEKIRKEDWWTGDS